MRLQFMIFLDCLQVRVTPMRTEVIIRATRTQNVLGEPTAPALCCLAPQTGMQIHARTYALMVYLSSVQLDSIAARSRSSCCFDIGHCQRCADDGLRYVVCGSAANLRHAGPRHAGLALQA